MDGVIPAWCKLLISISLWIIVDKVECLDSPPSPPKFPDIFQRTLKLPRYQGMFDKFRNENTVEGNCFCHRYLFNGRNYSASQRIPEDNCIITTQPPTTTVAQTTTTTTTSAATTTKVPPSTTSQFTRGSSTISTQKMPVIAPQTSVVPTNVPSTSSSETTWTDEESSSASPTLVLPKDIAVTDTLEEGLTVIIGVCAGIVGMIFVAAIFAVCRRCYVSPAARLKHDKIMRQRSDCQRIHTQISVTSSSSNSQPSTPPKEFINGYSDRMSKGTWATYDSDASRPNSSYRYNADEETAEDFRFNTIRAIEHPHALQTGFGETDADKTLPRKKMSKKDRKRFKVNDKRKSSMELNGIDTNSNDVASDAMCSKKGFSSVTLENELIQLDGGKVSYAPRKQSVHSKSDSIGTWSDKSADKSTGPLIEDDLVSDKNAELFAYSNPTFAAEVAITPPREFQDSSQEISRQESHVVLEPNIAIVHPVKKEQEEEPLQSDEDVQPVSVKQRASIFEAQKPVSESRKNSSSNNNCERKLSEGRNGMWNGKPAAHSLKSYPMLRDVTERVFQIKQNGVGLKQSTSGEIITVCIRMPNILHKVQTMNSKKDIVCDFSMAAYCTASCQCKLICRFWLHVEKRGCVTIDRHSRDGFPERQKAERLLNGEITSHELYQYGIRMLPTSGRKNEGCSFAGFG
ncbi:hypothetical protein CAPTEDRAFT_211670 [Capitella teleta]|uniref:MANSC domain-containing protein n=1 Tax=Capitella teleta TaxID=283909 RepID=R7UN53_CAPTE|nr:hypothetical protein CAPTEDRAFT_211670 [Capitella teleta]|eukprot:ELU07630.1 hypothetical protein CAPTEDRAFT_211670 [Capitella teleta]